MVTPDLLIYLKSEIDRGVDTQSLKTALEEQGWSDSDISEAFARSSPASEIVQPNPDVSFSRKPLAVFAVIGIALALIGIFSYYLLNSQGNRVADSPQSEVTVVPSKAPVVSGVSPTVAPSPTTSPVELFSVYSESVQGFSFMYPHAWKVQTRGEAVSLVDPDSTDLVSGNALVTTVSYTGSGLAATQSAQQVKDLARQIATGKNPKAVSFGTLVGYEALVLANGGTTYNVVLQGREKILLLQFPKVRTKADMSFGQLLILNTLREL